MADHKFVYTVSGARLSEEQQNKISQAIGTAVAHVLASGDKREMRGDFLNVGRINGGLWIDVQMAEKMGLEQVMKSAAVTEAGPARAA